METNSYAIDVQVTLSDGRIVPIQLPPQSAFIDDKGYVRLFSMHYNDGTVGNFKLHQEAQPSQIIEMTKKFLVPLGIEMAGVYFTHKSMGTKYHNIAHLSSHLAKHHGPDIIGNAIDSVYKNWQPVTGAYYEMTTGEKVIKGPIKLVRI